MYTASTTLSANMPLTYRCEETPVALAQKFSFCLRSPHSFSQETCRSGMDQGNETHEQEHETAQRRRSFHAQMVERQTVSTEGVS